jgi:hypothetical protein
MKAQSTHPVLHRLVAGASLTLALGSLGLTEWSVARAAVAVPVQSQVTQGQSSQRAINPSAIKGLPDGVYLYGQSAEPDKLGKAYFVFESRQGKVLGAFYMPRSSFDCAYGTFQPDKVALTVMGSYEKTANPYEIAIARTASVATNGGSALPKVELDGFNQITKVSANDQRILNVCKATYPQALK